MEASRKIKASSKLSFRGKHNSTKMHRMIPWESTLERDFIKLLDYDPTVISYKFQPEKINYVYKGKKRKYFPDFHVLKNDMKEYIYEVKAFEKTEDEENKVKFQVGMKFCSERKMKYVVVTEKEIRKGFLIENLDILSEVRQDSTSRKIMNVVFRTLEKLGGKTNLGTLKKGISQFNEEEVESNIFHLIYTHQLKMDLISAPISDESFVERMSN
ncbi:TnsA endonuclease N-terminal domain-containing protein [Mesobacillus subterraneus]|uniref:TnsA endonuclease N-terminal domain-containing protein n=1 Tax=Mesobacillus subterraneus TaxID=285983 RepID=UPI002041ADC9|nr:TnsA endonuclease N-terminal domain-containing protein [Mesobacillus subterraneus]MCM3576406.1 TnsA endonuclease N-terminal domain-containing protein [Mesobacillus subterraneus]